jgi:hypothetical protein
MEAFAGAPLGVQLELFPFLAANVAALDRLLGPISAPNAKAAASAAAKRRHREVMEEICRGHTDLANLLLAHLGRMLGQDLCPRGLAILRAARVPSAPAHSGDNNNNDKEEEKEYEE